MGRDENTVSTHKISSIEVTFPVPVELPPGWEQALSALVGMVCEHYEQQHPMRTMWASGHGAKILWREPHEPDFDDEVLSINVAEREAYPRELARRASRNDVTTEKPDGER